MALLQIGHRHPPTHDKSMTYTRRLRITIGNKSYDVTVEDLTEADSYRTPAASPHPAPAVSSVTTPGLRASRPQPPESGAITSPLAGTIKSILVKVGDRVTASQPVVILEAMKMENQISSPVPGTVKSVEVKTGDNVREGQVLVGLE